MATYRVPQDVEAEDKLLGPLTFKQFIFMLITAGAVLMAWLLYSIEPVMAILPLPIIVIFGGLTVFRREDQPVERYLLSFFNYLLRPRVRLWSTEGYYEHLVITAPKTKAAPELKRDLSEVHGQLEKLAQLVDTRGWSTRQADLVAPGQRTVDTEGDDRLFLPEVQQEEEAIPENEDIMDDSNPEVAHIDTMLQEHSQKQRQEVMEKVRQQSKSADQHEEGGLHYDPYPSSMHQHRINPDGSGNISEQHKWLVYKGGEKLSEHDNEQDAFAAFTNNGGERITGPEGKDLTEPLKKKFEATQQQSMQDTSDIMELSGELKVSQIADKVNRSDDDDQNLKEGEEIKLR